MYCIQIYIYIYTRNMEIICNIPKMDSPPDLAVPCPSKATIHILRRSKMLGATPLGKAQRTEKRPKLLWDVFCSLSRNPTQQETKWGGNFPQQNPISFMKIYENFIQRIEECCWNVFGLTGTAFFVGISCFVEDF